MAHCLAIPLLLICSSFDENGLLVTSTDHLTHEYHQITLLKAACGCGNPHVGANELNSVFSFPNDYPTPNPSLTVDSQPTLFPLPSTLSVQFQFQLFNVNSWHIAWSLPTSI
jgi:hypothetical protein